MKRANLIIIFQALAFILLISCEKENNSTKIPVIEGIYSGTFTATYKDINKSYSGNVKIELKNGNFTSTANANKYPAGGSGTYQIKDKIIIFQDKNFWTTEIDGNLILTSSYHFKIDGSTLTLSKGDRMSNYYEYKVVKE